MVSCATFFFLCRLKRNSLVAIVTVNNPNGMCENSCNSRLCLDLHLRSKLKRVWILEGGKCYRREKQNLSVLGKICYDVYEWINLIWSYAAECSIDDMSFTPWWYEIYISCLQVGPGVVFLLFEHRFLGRGVMMHCVTPVEPLLQCVSHTIFYQNTIPPLVPKFILRAECIQVTWRVNKADLKFGIVH